MAPRLGAPRRIACAQTADRTAQVGPMPRGPAVGFVQEPQQVGNFRVHFFSGARVGSPHVVLNTTGKGFVPNGKEVHQAAKDSLLIPPDYWAELCFKTTLIAELRAGKNLHVLNSYVLE